MTSDAPLVAEAHYDSSDELRLTHLVGDLALAELKVKRFSEIMENPSHASQEQEQARQHRDYYIQQATVLEAKLETKRTVHRITGELAVVRAKLATMLITLSQESFATLFSRKLKSIFVTSE